MYVKQIEKLNVVQFYIEQKAGTQIENYTRAEASSSFTPVQLSMLSFIETFKDLCFS